jgi:hypothetical protein
MDDNVNMVTGPMAGHNIEPQGSPTVSMIADWLLSQDRDTRAQNYCSAHLIRLAAPRQELLLLDENRKVSWKGHDAGLAPVEEVQTTGLIVKPAYLAATFNTFGELNDDHPGIASQYEFPFTSSSAPSLSTSLETSPQSTSLQSFLPPESTNFEADSSPATSMSTSTSTSTSNYGNVPCRSCSKHFCDSSTRNRHEKLHRPKYFDIACSSCGDTFGRNDACLKHIRNLHAGATEGVHPVKISKLA